MIGAAVQRLRAEAVILPLEDDVDHARDGIGAILRRGAVLKHLDPLDGGGGDEVEIDRRGALLRPGVEVEQRGGVAPFAVDQHQRLIGREPAQAERIDQGALIQSHHLPRDGRGDLGQGIAQVGLAGRGQCLGADHGDRAQALLGGAVGIARAGDDDIAALGRRLLRPGRAGQRQREQGRGAQDRAAE
jgi:hypothetical protein